MSEEEVRAAASSVQEEQKEPSIRIKIDSAEAEESRHQPPQTKDQQCKRALYLLQITRDKLTEESMRILKCLLLMKSAPVLLNLICFPSLELFAVVCPIVQCLKPSSLSISTD